MQIALEQARDFFWPRGNLSSLEQERIVETLQIQLEQFPDARKLVAEALAKFGSLYADQTEKDWEELRKAKKLLATSR